MHSSPISIFHRLPLLSALLFLLALLFVLVPNVVLAASDDVTLNVGQAVLSVNGITLNVYITNAEVESITVNSTNFTVNLQSGSDIHISAPNFNQLTASPSTYNVSSTCSAGESTLRLTGTEAATVTITPSATLCSTDSTTSSTSLGGGGIVGLIGTSGGGGGGSTPAAPTPVAIPAATSPVAQIVSPVFNQTLRFGMTNDDVVRLQELLASDPDIYPEGLTTGYFGSLTRSAVERFQAKHGIVSSGDEATTGYGLVGPATRAKLNEVFGGTSITPAPQATAPLPVASTVSSVFTTGLSRGMTNDDVRRLQELLATDPSVYPDGIVSGFFGPLTERAVERFQEKYGVAGSSDPGYGYVGPKTRAKLNEIFGSTN